MQRQPFAVLHQAIEHAAEQAPDREAVRCGGQALTYAQLADRAARLASLLRAEGVRRGDRVGIHAGKGLAATIAMYGIMKSGAAYVPLDPASPPARQAFVLRDCGIRHVVTEPARARALRTLLDDGAPIDCVVGAPDDLPPGVRGRSWDDVAAQPADGHDPRLDEADRAYILYTSGSTGTPKGVMHSHRSALAFARTAAAAYGFTSDDRLSNHAPLHFDLSTLDYFASAVAGATTVVVPEPYTRVPASLSALIESERLTVLYAVPLALTQLALHGALEKRDLTSLRWVLFGGEPFPPKHLRALMKALPRARFANLYGPTEVNGVTHWILPEQPFELDGAVPIGRPFDGMEVIIVDEHGHEVADGESGELLVRTPTMMDGYWNRPDLDAHVFDSRPQLRSDHDVYLRTGDLVRRRADGLLEFLGRRDRQVKIRGHRFELDEVEAALLSHEGVEAAAVFAVRDSDGVARVEAAVTLRQAGIAGPEALRAHLSSRIPRYAVPDRIGVLESMPRTASGKIDRHALSRSAESALRPAEHP